MTKIRSKYSVLGPGVQKNPFGYRVAHHGYLLTSCQGQDKQKSYKITLNYTKSLLNKNVYVHDKRNFCSCKFYFLYYTYVIILSCYGL